MVRREAIALIFQRKFQPLWTDREQPVLSVDEVGDFGGIVHRKKLALARFRSQRSLSEADRPLCPHWHLVHDGILPGQVRPYSTSPNARTVWLLPLSVRSPRSLNFFASGICAAKSPDMTTR